MEQKIKKNIKAFAPATIANLACGFDKLGVAIKAIKSSPDENLPEENIGDIVSIFFEEKDTPQKKTEIIKIEKVIVNDSEVPSTHKESNSDDFSDFYNPEKNKLTIPIIHYLKDIKKLLKNNTELSEINPNLRDSIVNDRFILKISLTKNIPLASGMGSSACSSVVGVYAVNKLLGKPIQKRIELLKYSILGECPPPLFATPVTPPPQNKNKSNTLSEQHFDNIAPALCGGLMIVTETTKDEFKKLDLPDDIYFVIFHDGKTKLDTSKMRSELDSAGISTEDKEQQEKYYTNFIKALDANNPNYPDYELIKHSMKDITVEPVRKKYIPLFDDIQRLALEEKNCLGCSLSGSGPSVFAMVRGLEVAKKIEKVWKKFQKSDAYKKAYQKQQILLEDKINKTQTFVKIFVNNQKGAEEIS